MHTPKNIAAIAAIAAIYYYKHNYMKLELRYDYYLILEKVSTSMYGFKKNVVAFSSTSSVVKD